MLPVALRKSPTMTPARLEANRQNARKSTGPRTARGKAYSRLNALKSGVHSPFFTSVLRALDAAPPGGTDAVARMLLTPELAAHPIYAQAMDMFRQADQAVAAEFRTTRLRWENKKKNSFF